MPPSLCISRLVCPRSDHVLSLSCLCCRISLYYALNQNLCIAPIIAVLKHQWTLRSDRVGQNACQPTTGVICRNNYFGAQSMGVVSVVWCWSVWYTPFPPWLIPLRPLTGGRDKLRPLTEGYTRLINKQHLVITYFPCLSSSPNLKLCFFDT